MLKLGKKYMWSYWNCYKEESYWYLIPYCRTRVKANKNTQEVEMTSIVDLEPIYLENLLIYWPEVIDLKIKSKSMFRTTIVKEAELEQLEV